MSGAASGLRLLPEVGALQAGGEADRLPCQRGRVPAQRHIQGVAFVGNRLASRMPFRGVDVPSGDVACTVGRRCRLTFILRRSVSG
jgi:hypothetical protein